MTARVTMLAMHRDGIINLPAPTRASPRAKPIVFGAETEPPSVTPPTTLDDVRPLQIHTVFSSTHEGRLWNEFIARHHYLGCKTLVGHGCAMLAVHDRRGSPLAVLGFSTAAWRLASRDTFIGWTPRKRERNLPLVMDNPRFLILPWIQIPDLGSHILSIICRRLPAEWSRRYKVAPVLTETFVEIPTYTGTVYRASGWIHAGTTEGRGRYDRYKKSEKVIRMKPLRRSWKRILNR